MIKYVVTTACIIFTAILVYILFKSYSTKHENIIISTSSLFKEAVNINEKKIMQGIPFYTDYDPKKSPNDISGKEKLEWSIQYYITACDTNRLSLDSIFHSTLIDHYIFIPSAVSVSFNGKTYYSQKDTSFYHSAIPLTAVVYRKNYISKDQIILKGYIKPSFFFILKQINILPLMIILWLTAMIAIIIGYKSWQKRIFKANKEELIENHKPVKAMIIEWTDLSNDIYFDKENGIIKHEDKTIILKNNSLKLFILLVNKMHGTVPYSEFCNKVLMRK
jgi:hypothetical protein